MSENLDLVGSIYAAWERGDFTSAGWAHPEIEFVRVAGYYGRETTTGLAGMAVGFRDFLAAWEDYSAEAKEYRELDDERVLVLSRTSGRGKTSGIELGELHVEGAVVFEVHDGKVTRLVLYRDGERALADLGLGE
jgi:ketosteroid isomerase-like protein